MDYARNIVSFVSFFVVMFIAVLLIMKDFDKVMAKLREDEEFQGIREVGQKVILYVKTFIKAQLIILCVISTVCALVLALMGMKGGIFYGVLTGFMDMSSFYRDRHYAGSSGNIPSDKRELSAGGSVSVPLRCLRADSGVFRAKTHRGEDWRMAGRNSVCGICGDSSVWRLGNHQGAPVAGDYL